MSGKIYSCEKSFEKKGEDFSAEKYNSLKKGTTILWFKQPNDLLTAYT